MGTFEQAEATVNQEGDWAFCEEPPIDPNVTCFLASDVEYLADKAPEGQPWLCTTSSALHDPMPDITHEVQERGVGGLLLKYDRSTRRVGRGSVVCGCQAVVADVF